MKDHVKDLVKDHVKDLVKDHVKDLVKDHVKDLVKDHMDMEKAMTQMKTAQEKVTQLKDVVDATDVVVVEKEFSSEEDQAKTHSKLETMQNVQDQVEIQSKKATVSFIN